MSAPQQGSEKRSSVLPSMVPSGLGAFGSAYNPADAMLTPKQIGVQVGDSMSDVVAGVKGVGFYIDQIGFGEPSTGLTRGMNLRPLGVNYFLRTGMKCSNGAEMWRYIEGIPKGDALGGNVQKVMQDMGLPGLRGLAPGILEDVQRALNPAPLMNAVFGSGYPQCRLSDELLVGDSYGNIRDPNTGEAWISDPDSAKYNGSVYTQRKWIQNVDRFGNPVNLSRDEWAKGPKTYNADGTPINPEGFADMLTNPGTVVVVGVLCLLAFGVMRKR